MKKLFLIAAVVAALVSCSKSDAPQVKDGVQMTLKASLGADTKLSFNPDGNMIKSTWDASETISVITLEGKNGKVVSIDNFTSTGAAGRRTADFTGTFTGGSDPKRVIVIYPAFDASGQTPMCTPITGLPFSALTGLEVGNAYLSTNFSWVKQIADNDCSHLKNYCIIAGEADITDIKTNVLTTDLSLNMPVFKVNCTFPDSYKGKDLTRVTVQSFNSSGDAYSFMKSFGWNYADIANSSIQCPGGGFRNDAAVGASFAVPASGKATVYIPFVEAFKAVMEPGYYFDITATVDGSTLTCKKTFSSSKNIERDKVYTINATFE